MDPQELILFVQHIAPQGRIKVFVASEPKILPVDSLLKKGHQCRISQQNQSVKCCISRQMQARFFFFYVTAYRYNAKGGKVGQMEAKLAT